MAATSTNGVEIMVGDVVEDERGYIGVVTEIAEIESYFDVYVDGFDGSARKLTDYAITDVYASECKHIREISWIGDNWRCGDCGDVVDTWGEALVYPRFAVGDYVKVVSYRPDFDGKTGEIVNREWSRYGGETYNSFHYDVLTDNGKIMRGFKDDNLQIVSRPTPEAPAPSGAASLLKDFDEITPADYAAVEAMGETAENVFSDDASETMPEAVGGFERPCEHCGGSGHITMHGLYIVVCDECDGTGIHTEPQLTELDALRAENEALKQQLAAARGFIELALKRILQNSPKTAQWVLQQALTQEEQ